MAVADVAGAGWAEDVLGEDFAGVGVDEVDTERPVDGGADVFAGVGGCRSGAALLKRHAAPASDLVAQLVRGRAVAAAAVAGRAGEPG